MEEERQTEIHVLRTAGFVPGLPGSHGPGDRVVVDALTKEPLEVISLAEWLKTHQEEQPVQEPPPQVVHPVEFNGNGG